MTRKTSRRMKNNGICDYKTEQDYKLEIRDSQNLTENEEQRDLRLQRLRESRSLEKVNPYEYKRELNSRHDRLQIARDNTARRTTKQTPTASTKCCYVQREQEATTSTRLK